jgi:ribosomal protein S18 acetylase RimI-like enzyme
VKIREFSFPDDYPETLRLWQSIDKGMQVGRSDTLDEIEKKLKRDPDLFLVAEVDEGIVGTVIGGFDGRRGMIYHLAVHESVRKQGVGASLLSEVEDRLQRKGCIKCYLLAFVDNVTAIEFYEKRGWIPQSEDIVLSKVF